MQKEVKPFPQLVSYNSNGVAHEPMRAQNQIPFEWKQIEFAEETQMEPINNEW
jgi:hypothetical protein